jgi:hypothetical protein
MDVKMDGRGGVMGSATGEKAVAAYERVLAAAMKHNTTLRICLYAMACLMLVVSAVLIVFAPAGRETAVIIVSLALFLVAAGCAGFATFKLKAPGIELQAAEASPESEKYDSEPPPIGDAAAWTRRTPLK